MEKKPTILLVTGAFTTGKCYDRVLPYLQKAGYRYAVAGLPSANPTDPSRHSATSDGEYVLEEYLMPLLHEGSDVVVFAHSFGATCLGGAEVPIAKSARQAEGLQGGVLGLVYMSFAFVLEGKSQFQVLGGKWPPFCKVDTPSPGLLTFDPVIETLYNDAPAPMREELEAGHIPSSISIFTTPVLSPLWQDRALDGRRVCIKTHMDQTFPPFVQDMFLQECGVDWKVVDIDGGHCAFVSRPEEVAGIIVEASEEWARA